MGETFIRLIIKHPRFPEKQATSEFLVDSGAHYTVLPYRMVQQLGLKPSYEQEFVLADGKIMKRAISSASIVFQKKELAVPVVLGKRGDVALFGVTTLEGFGLMLDPFKRKLYHSTLMLG